MNNQIKLHNDIPLFVGAETLATSCPARKASQYLKSKVPHASEVIVKPASPSMPHERWELQTSLYYYVFNQEWIVPKGFKTDFASIPQPFWFMYPPWRDDYGVAAILHDFHRRTRVVTKKQADGIFYEVMKQCGTDLFTRVVFYRAVRGFAWMG